MRLSIIIPALHDAALLEETMLSVLENRPANADVVVVHTGFYTDPYELAGEVKFVEARSASSEADCWMVGAAATSGEIVHLLSSGVVAVAGWADGVRALFADPAVAAVSPALRVGDAIASIGVAADSLGYRRYLPLEEGKSLVGPSRLAGFYRRTWLEPLLPAAAQLGDEAADLDLAYSLKAQGLLSRPTAASQLIVKSHCFDQQRDFASAAAAERLRARHPQQFETTGYWNQVLSQTLKSLPSPKAAIGVLLGHLSGGRGERPVSLEPAEIDTSPATIRMPQRPSSSSHSDRAAA
ncbi:glycosyltransferase family 2 protein [Blastopirellula marina]|uniref:Glycosyl transferase family 2 n=1 Tax=Blastopirellula marina TaxID=124 RepID=A0A2S8FSL0_9BACT|nr:glycosyltransferase [Blastopirellula marina]PQO35171.1 hypothetical protein C5Y98_14570 [Blastopirellula marina]PQO47962.1 hypothetical protein C5Y93_00820 [Blastopirellula marina]PTL43920.1 hypothetical protein C5Y97_14580 [Blastopirellula marina]